MRPGFAGSQTRGCFRRGGQAGQTRRTVEWLESWDQEPMAGDAPDRQQERTSATAPTGIPSRCYTAGDLAVKAKGDEIS
jgi:hypothetical protein